MVNSILIADSGSTKTDWLLTDGTRQLGRYHTRGINPFMLTADEIENVIRQELPDSLLHAGIGCIRFYGAGCRGEQCDSVKRALTNVFGELDEITVDSDLVGAAQALFPNRGKGIACILGTGSNSGLFENGRITENVSPLGFILGDEGSGAVLGRKLLGNVLKKQFPEAICRAFHEKYALSSDEIIRRVYKEPFPNRFMASFVPFLSEFRNEPSVHELITEEFTHFFRRNIDAYNRRGYAVSFVGSIAFHFQKELNEAAEQTGYRIGHIVKSPLDAYLD